MAVTHVRSPRIGKVRHAQLRNSPQSLELLCVEQLEEQRVQRLFDLKCDHIVDRIANDLLRHAYYYVQGRGCCYSDKRKTRDEDLSDHCRCLWNCSGLKCAVA